MDRRFALLAGTIVLATVLAYLPAIGGGFIWDDDDYVTENPALGTWSGLKSIWLDPAATPQYYPLVHTTFWIEHQLWGYWPTGYHLVNVLIHAINAVLLWRLLIRLSVPGAWLAALIFALHPVHVESVAWITERKNVLSGMFYLMAAHCFLRYWDVTSLGSDTAKKTNSRRWYILAHICFLAALWSKTVAATLPAALLLLIWWKQGRIRVANVIKLSPMFAMGIGLGLLTVWLEKHHVGASGIDWDLSFVDRVLIAGRAIVFYATKLVFPVPLIFTYPRWHIDASDWTQYLYPVAVLVVVAALFLLRGRIGRGPLVAVLYFVGTLFPALGFFDVYPMRFSFVADHFQYLASIGVIVLATASAIHFCQWIQHHASANVWKWGARTIATMIVLALASLTWKQGRIYEGLEVLWRDTLAKNPNAFMAHNNLGALLNDRGEFAEAEQHLRASIEIKPDFVDSVVNLAKAREGQGDLAEALVLYRHAIEIDPTSAPAFNGLGVVLGMTGQNEQAENRLREAIRLNPRYALAFANLATLYAGMGRTDESIELFERALQIDPSLDMAKANLARVLMSRQQFQRAATLFRELLQTHPDDISTLLNLGVIAGNQQQYGEAIEYFRRVVAVNPRHLQAHYNLGAMYNAIGDVDRASQHFRRFEQLQAEATATSQALPLGSAPENADSSENANSEDPNSENANSEDSAAIPREEGTTTSDGPAGPL